MSFSLVSDSDVSTHQSAPAAASSTLVTLTQTPAPSPVTVQWMCGCNNCFWVVIYSKFIIQTYQRLLIENLDFCDNLIIQVEIIGKMQKGTYHKDNCVNHPCLTLKCLPSVRYAHIFMKAHVDRS